MTIGDKLNPAHKLVKRLQSNRDTLHIARIPPKTKEEFVEWATEEFCGDFGMALKFLWDGMPKADILSVVEGLQNHEERIVQLEAQQTIEPESIGQDKKELKMLNGNKIEVPKNG